MTVPDGLARVDAYAIELGRPEAVAPARALLAGDERERGARYVFDRDRDRFTVRRAALRTILARHLGCRPQELCFVAGPHGKPRLAGRHATSDVCFNLSASHDLAVCAVTRGREIGVDVERLRPVDDALDLARRCFSTIEHAALRRVCGDVTGAFFTCWTRKEAFVKALGSGLAQPLDRFSVSLDPDDGARLLDIDGDRDEAARWWLAELHPRAGFTGAIAALGGPADVIWSEVPL